MEQQRRFVNSHFTHHVQWQYQLRELSQCPLALSSHSTVLCYNTRRHLMCDSATTLISAYFICSVPPLFLGASKTDSILLNYSILTNKNLATKNSSRILQWIFRLTDNRSGFNCNGNSLCTQNNKRWIECSRSPIWTAYCLAKNECYSLESRRNITKFRFSTSSATAYIKWT